MKFCIDCSSILSPNTGTGELTFHCRCGKIYNSEPQDTLRFEEHIEAKEFKEKYQIFINNAAFDPAGNKVEKKCIECNMPYLTLIQIGINETTLYVCECGKIYRANEI